MICSHKYAYKYFIDSLDESNECRYPSYEWDGSYEGALGVVSTIRSNRMCPDCPEMGINAVKYGKPGMFMVVTGTEEPYCSKSNKP